MPDLSRPCIGCLGSRQCWVCSGTGYHHPLARRGLCERCAGTGICELCAAADAEPDVDPPGQQHPTIPPPRAMPAPTVRP